MNEPVFNLITQIEQNLKAFVELSSTTVERSWLLNISLFYEGQAAGSKSFNLHGYEKEEAEDIAKSIHKNDFLMKEIDEYLWGESD